MNKKRLKLTRITSLLLTVFLSFSLWVPVFGFAGDYDYTDLGSDKNEFFSPADMLEEHLTEAVSNAERSFLESYSTLAFKYNPVINANRVTLEYEAGTLTACAKEYSYSSENGKTLVWIPDYVSVQGKTKFFEKLDESYVVALEVDSADDAEIYYKAETAISKNDFNLILNLYYYTAKYAADMADYETKRIAYEKYVYEKRLYDDALAKYNEYLADLEEYNDILYKYEHYDELLAKYEIDKAKYDAYLESLKTNAEDIKKYEEYEAKLATARKQLCAFELVYVEMKDGRNIYEAVMGGTVDQVLASVGQIIKELGKEYKDKVETAEAATKSLRALMTTYKEFESEEEKYFFYASNYARICESVFNLASSLDELYYAPGVKAGMHALEKHEKYVILVSQLVLTSCALIDGEVRHKNVLYGDTWKIDQRTYTEILENNTYFVDDDTSTPLEKGYPTEVKKPDLEVAPNPTLPIKPSSKPIEPTEVLYPGDVPAEVTFPEKPDAENGIVSSVFDKLGDSERAVLCEKILNDEIRIRNSVISPKTIKLQTKIYKKLASETVTLVFKYRSTSGEMQTYSLITDKDTPVVYDGAIPDTYTDETGTYAFDGWLFEDTEASAELSLGFSENTVFIPKYKNVTTYFDVTWKVGDESIIETHPSNLIPAPQFVPELPDEGCFCFEFAGWDREIEPLTADVTYTALFNKVYIVPIDDGGAAVTVDNGTLICDASRFENGLIDVSKLIPRVDGKYSLKLITDVGELEFSFTDVSLMASLGVTAVGMSYQSNGVYVSVSAFKLYGVDGNEITDSGVFAKMKIKHELENLTDTVLKRDDAYVKFSSDETYVYYRAEAGAAHELVKEYSVLVVKNDLVEIKTDKTVAYTDDAVRFEIIKKPGVEILSILVSDKNGNLLNFDKQNNAVIVTDSDIVISVTARYEVYNIVFVSNGVVISYQELTYGAMPKIPSDPTTAADEKYSYTFMGWTPEVTEVNGDAVYEACFEKTPLQSVEEEKPPRENFFARVFKAVFNAVYNIMREIRAFFDDLFA